METRKHHTHGGIRFRAIEPEDLPDLKKWRNEQKRFYREYRMINTPHQMDWFTGMYNDRGHIHYAIDVWDNRWLLVGSCNWSNIDWVHRHAELGIYIGDPEWRGKGVGLKAMVELHKIAFHELGMHTVRLEVYSFNPAVEFYLKFGYKEVGRWRRGCFYNGHYHGSVLMDMTELDWTILWREKYSDIGNLKHKLKEVCDVSGYCNSFGLDSFHIGNEDAPGSWYRYTVDDFKEAIAVVEEFNDKHSNMQVEAAE